MIHPTIKSSLDKSIDYQTYVNLIDHLVSTNSTSGLDKTQALADYTKLNARRLKRWDKTLKISDETKQKVLAFDRKVTWLVITESWCGDAAHVIPVLNKLAELNKNIDLKFVLRDENLELMDMFLTNGGRAIAKVIMLDNETGEVFNTYGPRPTEATANVEKFKAAHGKLTAEFKEDLQMWYNKNKGQNVIDDITAILCAFEPNLCT